MINELSLHYASVDELFLDPLNPRVGRHNLGPNIPQEDILEMVADWALDELAHSYLENGGFWLQEALLVVQEALYGSEQLVVVEGNRRLAALKFLKDAEEGRAASIRWEQLAHESEIPNGLFTRVPYFLLDSRDDVQAYLGFRHVTGIKQWDADEKAYFIAKLIDDQQMTYEEVMRMIGSTTPAVRRHYLAYRTLLQIETNVEDYNRDRAEDSFSLLYMTLDTQGARDFLKLAIDEPPPIHRPVPDSHLEQLKEFAGWLFGSSRTTPVVSDTRQVSKLGAILRSKDSIDYLRRTQKPDLEHAYQLAGGQEDDLVRILQQASDSVKDSLAFAYDFRESMVVQRAVKQLGTDALALLRQFPVIRKELLSDECDDERDSDI